MTTRQRDLLMETTWTQLMDRDLVKRSGFSMRTMNQLIEKGLAFELNGFFEVTNKGYRMLNATI